MASAAFTLYLIHVGAWEYLLSSSASYMTLVWALDSKVMIIYPILSVTAAIFTVALLVVIFLPQADKKSKIVYRVIASLSLLCSFGCIVFKTICNQWYFVQALLAVAVVICLFSGINDWIGETVSAYDNPVN